ncbi:hypothetical protein BC826DRAFT_973152 [Russula brevipes]|nr:hypothetical protein BC826DRAFT_973152 [Russula brevipes]
MRKKKEKPDGPGEAKGRRGRREGRIKMIGGGGGGGDNGNEGGGGDEEVAAMRLVVWWVWVLWYCARNCNDGRTSKQSGFEFQNKWCNNTTLNDPNVVVVAKVTTLVHGQRTCMLSVPPHRSNPLTAHAARPPTSGSGGGGEGYDFGAWATNMPLPLRPQTDALRAHFLTCTGAQMLTGPAVHMPRSSTPPIVHVATRPDTADTAAAPDTQDLTCITRKLLPLAPLKIPHLQSCKTAASCMPQAPNFKTTRKSITRSHNT